MTIGGRPELGSAATGDAETAEKPTAPDSAAGEHAPIERSGTRRAWLRQMWRHLLSQHTTTLRLSVAVGVGILIGNLPFYGFHLPICIATAWLLGLNHVTTYLAANISNPSTAPLLAFGAIQVGQRILFSAWLPLSVEELRARGVVEFFESWLLGSVLVGCVLGFVGSCVTYCVVGRWRHHHSPHEDALR